MNRYAVCAAASALLSTTVMAADFELAAPAGGGVAVKNSNGVVTWKVDSAGNVVIPTLPSSLTGSPLCWNETTGVLSKCPAGAVADTTPPVITTTAPAVATGHRTTFTTTYTDETELASVNAIGVGLVGAMEAGIKTYQSSNTVDTPLGSALKNYTAIATDMAGNVGKKTFEIIVPSTAIKFGSYLVAGTYNVPTGFNCSDQTGVYPDGTPIAQVNIFDTDPSYSSMNQEPYSGWSSSGGYRPFVSVRSPVVAVGPTITYYAFARTAMNQTLDGTSIPLDSVGLSQSGGGSSGSLSVKYVGTLNRTQTSPPTVAVTLTMQCNINNAGFVNGTTASPHISPHSTV